MSYIFHSEVWHERIEPKHVFSYPLYYFGLNLKELKLPFLNRNKKGFLSFIESDYLFRNEKPLDQKLSEILASENISAEEIILVTVPRYFNYTFNPVNFYFCYNQELSAVIVEINNTFDEKHIYVLTNLKLENGFYTAEKNKEFHVSPFNDVAGNYQFKFKDLKKELHIEIDLYKDSKLHFKSGLKGKTLTYNRLTLIRTLLIYPLSAVLSMPRILFEAGKLKYQKKLEVYHKPTPTSKNTIGFGRPNFFDRYAKNKLLKIFSGITDGAIEFVLYDGTKVIVGDLTKCKVTVRINRRDFFWKLLLRGDIAIGETFMWGEWESDNPTEFLKILIRNYDYFYSQLPLVTKIAEFFEYIKSLSKSNTVKQSKDNIHEHYDLGNNFFKLWLDPSMMYSSAMFKNSDTNLEEAQYNKLSTLIKKCHITSEHHVLEIGSGWGTFAIFCAQQTGAKVTTITISKEQFEHTTQRIKDLKLEHLVDIKLCDYRALEGKYDRIVSIEMLEAVGKEFLPVFFKKTSELLNLGGIVALQAITMPDCYYSAYSKRCDWIQRYIFPGSHLPAISSILDALKDYNLVINDVEDIGQDYAKTLRIWRENFIAKLADIKKLGFDEQFIKKWEYYLFYCEAGFALRHIHNMQIVISNPHNQSIKDL